MESRPVWDDSGGGAENILELLRGNLRGDVENPENVSNDTGTPNV